MGGAGPYHDPNDRSISGRNRLGVGPPAGPPTRRLYAIHPRRPGEGGPRRPRRIEKEVRTDRDTLVKMTHRMTELVRHGVPKDAVFGQLGLADLAGITPSERWRSPAASAATTTR